MRSAGAALGPTCGAWSAPLPAASPPAAARVGGGEARLRPPAAGGSGPTGPGPHPVPPLSPPGRTTTAPVADRHATAALHAARETTGRLPPWPRVAAGAGDAARLAVSQRDAATAGGPCAVAGAGTPLERALWTSAAG
jgi:hypothetical protein